MYRWASRPTDPPRPVACATSGPGGGASGPTIPRACPATGAGPATRVQWRVDARGEIKVRADRAGVLFSGYRRADGLVQPFDDDGWFATGDLGRVDEAGNLVFIERASESIRVKGEFVPIGYVEQRFASVDGVTDVAVWRRSSELVDDEIVLYLVGPSIPTEAIAAVSRQLPPFMQPGGGGPPGRDPPRLGSGQGPAEDARRRHRAGVGRPGRRHRDDRHRHHDRGVEMTVIDGMVDFHVHSAPEPRTPPQPRPRDDGRGQGGRGGPIRAQGPRGILGGAGPAARRRGGRRRGAQLARGRGQPRRSGGGCGARSEGGVAADHLGAGPHRGQQQPRAQRPPGHLVPGGAGGGGRGGASGVAGRVRRSRQGRHGAGLGPPHHGRGRGGTWTRPSAGESTGSW